MGNPKIEDAQELYQRLVDPTSPKDDEEIRRIYKKLLSSGEQLTSVLSAIEGSFLPSAKVHGDAKRDETSNLAKSRAAGASSFETMSHGSSPATASDDASLQSHAPFDNHREKAGSFGNDNWVKGPPASEEETQASAHHAKPRAPADATATVGDTAIDVNESDITARAPLSSEGARPSSRHLVARWGMGTAVIALAAALWVGVGVSLYAWTHRASEQATFAAEHPVAEAPLAAPKTSAGANTAVPPPAATASAADTPTGDGEQPPARPAAVASGGIPGKEATAITSSMAPPTPAAERELKTDAVTVIPKTDPPAIHESPGVRLPAAPASMGTIPARDTNQPPAAAASDSPPIQGGVAVLSPTTPSPPAAEPPLKADAAISAPETDSPPANETASVSLPEIPASSAAIPARDTDQPPTPVASDSPPVKETPATPPTASSPPSAPRRTGTASDGPSAQLLVTEKRISSVDAMALLARGDTLFAAGDVAAARLFYERGANGGNAEAALRLGETYDSSFLAQVGLTGVRGDMPKAISWYQRAGDLGSKEASEALKRITGR